MAVTLTGSNGLFTRLGAIFKLVERVETHQTDGTSGIEAELQDILDEYSSADLDMVQAIIGQFENMQNSAAQGIYPLLRRASETTIIEMVHDDNGTIPKDIDSSLQELIEQMLDNSDSVDGDAASITTSADGDNTGTAVVWHANRFKHQIPELWPSLLSGSNTVNARLRAESLRIEVRSDSQIRGTAGRETYSIIGEPAIQNINDPDWPGGSGTRSTGRVVNPSEDAKESVYRNLLTNSDFEGITSNVPDNWTLDVGAAGTDVLEETSTVYRGNKAIEIVGDGSTNVALRQTFNTSGGTQGQLKPYTIYGIHLRFQIDVSPAAGILTCRIVDGSNNQIGTSFLSVTLADGSITTGQWEASTADLSWATGGFVFSPASIPDTAKFELRMSTALSSGTSLFLDDVVFFEAPPIGSPRGPQLALIRGETDVIEGDNWGVTISNSYAGSFQKHFDRFFDITGRGYQLPINTSGGETISDSLIS